MILRDFPTKSLFLVFNFWVSENTCFHVFDVSGATGIQIAKGKKPCQFFFGRKAVGTRHKGGGPGGPKGGSPRGQIPWPRVGPPNGPTAPPPRGLLLTTPSSPKTNTLIFPRRDGAARAAKLSKLSAGETDPAAPELRRRGKSSPSSSPSPPWRGRRHLHHHPHQHLHLHHRHHRDPLRSPHSLIIATP